MANRVPSEFADYPAALKARVPFGPYRAVVTYVVDGDTVDVLTDRGFNDYPYLAIRVAGIKAHELFTGNLRGPAAEARRHAVHLVHKHGRWCIVHSQKWSPSFGRYVAQIELTDGTDLGERMVADGYATRSDGSAGR